MIKRLSRKDSSESVQCQYPTIIINESKSGSKRLSTSTSTSSNSTSPTKSIESMEQTEEIAESIHLTEFTDMERLTLETMMNKQTYMKYLSLVEPSQVEKAREYLIQKQKHAPAIIKLVQELINDDLPDSYKLKEKFDSFFNEALQYLEYLQHSTNNSINESNDNDNLFN